MIHPFKHIGSKIFKQIDASLQEVIEGVILCATTDPRIVWGLKLSDWFGWHYQQALEEFY